MTSRVRMGFLYQLVTAKMNRSSGQNLSDWTDSLWSKLFLYNSVLKRFSSFLYLHCVCSTGPYYCDGTVGQRTGGFIHSHGCGRWWRTQERLHCGKKLTNDFTVGQAHNTAMFVKVNFKCMSVNRIVSRSLSW